MGPEFFANWADAAAESVTRGETTIVCPNRYRSA